MRSGYPESVKRERSSHAKNATKSILKQQQQQRTRRRRDLNRLAWKLMPTDTRRGTSHDAPT